MYYNPQQYSEILHRLESVKFSRAQSETLMANHRRATTGKNHWNSQPKAILEDLRLATKRDIDELRRETKQGIDDLRKETQMEFVKVRHEISDVRKDMRLGFIVLGALVLVAPNATSLFQLLLNLFKWTSQAPFREPLLYLHGGKHEKNCYCLFCWPSPWLPTPPRP